jgi:hypothetical protein
LEPVRTTWIALMLAAALTACDRIPVAGTSGAAGLPFAVHQLASSSTPSPLDEVRAGHVRAVFPHDWDAAPLPAGSVPQEGFVASPRLDRFERAAGVVQGMEAFWIDVGGLHIPSDYYYLAARNEALSPFSGTRACRLGERQVLLDRPPDLTGATASPGDYVATASGTCRLHGRPARWGYVVAAPGYGPIRDMGLRTSGLYVVMALVSGPNADRLLKEMIEGARFGDTPISQIVQAAGRLS